MKTQNPLKFSIFAAVICFAVFLTAVASRSFQDRIGDHAFWIFLVGVGCILFAFVSKLKIGDVVEFERLERKVKQLLNGEVLCSPRGVSFYVDSDGKSFRLPDQSTAKFLRTSRGQISLSDSEIEEYAPHLESESVLNCRILKAKAEGHLFAVLNGKKYYINSWSPIVDWGRGVESFEEVEMSVISAIPTER